MLLLVGHSSAAAANELTLPQAKLENSGTRVSDLGRQLVRLQVCKPHGLVAVLLFRSSGMVFWLPEPRQKHSVLLAFCKVLSTCVWGRSSSELLALAAKYG